MKHIKLIIILLGSILVLTGCSKTITQTYDVLTGDKVKISLKDAGNYKLTKDTPFEILEDKKIIFKGSFMTSDGFENYKEAISNDTNASILEEKVKDDYEYILYKYMGATEDYSIIIKLNNSKTVVVLSGCDSLNLARKILNSLELEIV